MVYWGCATARNRCVWGVCISAALAGLLLLCAGAGRLWLCTHAPHAGDAGAGGDCKLRAGVLMVLGPLLAVLGVVPSLLFFQSCCAHAPPAPPLTSEGVRVSGITVVRQTPNGPQRFHYDAHGHLLAAPDCVRAGSPARGGSNPPSPVKAAAALPGSSSGGASGSGSEGGDTATAEVFVSLGPLARGLAGPK